ncbi:lipid II flippase MurJ [Halodesulfovibrio marinisediminis]|uniref:Murein biosynthesis integral membrane protein MurJ n=1 Tax=Halodesulfovibrio marinisediminis DSM 17456 TaxID=1121457 RepID=A0A1N6FSU9_9BACT|nr:lipid II flippase MurJ [Halodesulfovibrio marinisediminis]SIN98302.1 murein biosynthesis integral membrane protein MurJ [Halodesulfovibrio marinisediminis DSM 17456]
MLKNIIGSSVLIILGVLLGRLSGFVREILVASTYGTTNLADVAVLLLSLPDLLLNLLVGGALSAALIPSFVTQADQSKKLLFQASVVLLLLFSAITGILYLNTDMLMSLLAPGFSGEKVVLAQDGVAIALLLLPLSVLTGVTTAYLQSKNKFFLPSLGTLIFNGCIILGLVYMLLTEESSLSILLLSLIGAGVCRYTSQIIAVKPRWSLRCVFQGNMLSRELIKRFFQAMFSGGLLLTFPVIARSFASYQEAGSVALFNYSMRLIELPLLLCINFISIALLPRLAESRTTAPEVYRKLIVHGFQLILALGLCVAAVLTAGVVPYTNLVFGRSLAPSELDKIYGLVQIGLMSIVFQGVASFATTVCNAEKNTHKPLYVTLLGAVVLVAGLSLWREFLTTERIMLGLLAAYVLLSLMLLATVNLDVKCYRLLLREGFFYCGIVAVVIIGYWGVKQLTVLFSESLWLIFPMLAIGGGMLSTLLCMHSKARELLKQKVLKSV